MLLSSRNIRHHTGFLCVLRYFEIYQKKSSGNWSKSGLECPLEYLYFALFGFVIGSKISRHFLSQSKPTVIFFRAFLALATGPHVPASTRDWFMLVLGPLLIGHSNWQTTHAIRCLKASNRDLMIRQRRRKWKLHWKTQYAVFHSSNNYTKKAFSLPFTTDIKKEQRVSKPSKDNSLLLLHGQRVFSASVHTLPYKEGTVAFVAQFCFRLRSVHFSSEPIKVEQWFSETETC